MPVVGSRIKFDPLAFKLLMSIKDNINLQPIAGLSNKRLAELVVDGIKETSDRLGTPIFTKIDFGIVIYHNDKPIPIFKKSFEEYLAWTAKHFGIDKETVYDRDFRNMTFGYAWRVMAPEE